MPRPTDRSFPPVTSELVDALARYFPDRCPDGRESDLEIRERIGEVRVVRFLSAVAERQAKQAARPAKPDAAPA